MIYALRLVSEQILRVSKNIEKIVFFWLGGRVVVAVWIFPV